MEFLSRVQGLTPCSVALGLTVYKTWLIMEIQAKEVEQERMRRMAAAESSTAQFEVPLSVSSCAASGGGGARRSGRGGEGGWLGAGMPPA